MQVQNKNLLCLQLVFGFWFQMNGPYWQVPTGRRDGRVSKLQDVLNNLPAPTSTFSTLKSEFAGKGLSVKDLVVLSGTRPIIVYMYLTTLFKFLISSL